MKKLIFISLVFISFNSNAQQIKNLKTNEIIELKKAVSEYCSVIMQPNQGKYAFFIGIDSLGFWQCIDEKGSAIEFKTIVGIMNYLNDNGWEYINNIGGDNGTAPQYYFRKKKSL